MDDNKKFCEHCGKKIHIEAVICPSCGVQVEELKNEKEENRVIINNTVITNPIGTKKCDKWISFILCLFLGYVGAHKFYEGKTGLGVIYILTAGIFCIGWFVDIISILCKSNPYYV